MFNKITRSEADDLIRGALENFASELGLDYSTCREEIDGGKVRDKFLPEPNKKLEIEVTKETKDSQQSVVGLYAYINRTWRYGYDSGDKKPQEATLLGKVNALAEYLGVEFEVQPEKVTTTKVKAVTKKKTATKSKVTAKKGKK